MECMCIIWMVGGIFVDKIGESNKSAIGFSMKTDDISRNTIIIVEIRILCELAVKRTEMFGRLTIFGRDSILHVAHWNDDVGRDICFFDFWHVFGSFLKFGKKPGTDSFMGIDVFD